MSQLPFTLVICYSNNERHHFAILAWGPSLALVLLLQSLLPSQGSIRYERILDVQAMHSWIISIMVRGMILSATPQYTFIQYKKFTTHTDKSHHTAEVHWHMISKGHAIKYEHNNKVQL